MAPLQISLWIPSIHGVTPFANKKCFWFTFVCMLIRIKSHSPPFRDVRNMARLMSGIWPVKTGHFPDIKKRCPGNGQFLLSVFRTSKIDVRDMDIFYWPYSGHQHLMSGIWKVKTGHIPDIVHIPSGIWPGQATGVDPNI